MTVTPLLLQVGDDLEEAAHFLRREGRRRLIHDNDVRVHGERLSDLDHLALGDAQVLDVAFRVDGAVDPAEDLEKLSSRAGLA